MINYINRHIHCRKSKRNSCGTFVIKCSLPVYFLFFINTEGLSVSDPEVSYVIICIKLQRKDMRKNCVEAVCDIFQHVSKELILQG